jgi:uncharacterized Ntn-hydrolase superfamily protein
MTYTLLARCPKTGQVGIGIATYSICVGLYCNGLRGNVGATMTQAFVNQSNNPLAVRLLEQGFAPEHVLAELKANDPHHEYRQIAVIDRLGRLAAYSGPKNRGWAGHVVGDGYVAMGNVLTGKKTVDAMAEAYEATSDLSFERRLLAAIEAGRDAGGQSGNDGHLALGRADGLWRLGPCRDRPAGRPARHGRRGTAARLRGIRALSRLLQGAI